MNKDKEDEAQAKRRRKEERAAKGREEREAEQRQLVAAAVERPQIPCAWGEKCTCPGLDEKECCAPGCAATGKAHHVCSVQNGGEPVLNSACTFACCLPGCSAYATAPESSEAKAQEQVAADGREPQSFLKSQALQQPPLPRRKYPQELVDKLSESKRERDKKKEAGYVRRSAFQFWDDWQAGTADMGSVDTGPIYTRVTANGARGTAKDQDAGENEERAAENGDAANGERGAGSDKEAAGTDGKAVTSDQQELYSSLESHGLLATRDALFTLNLPLETTETLVAAFLSDVGAISATQGAQNALVKLANSTESSGAKTSAESSGSKARRTAHGTLVVGQCDQADCIVCKLWPRVEVASEMDAEPKATEMMRVAEELLMNTADKAQTLSTMRPAVVSVAQRLLAKSPESDAQQLGMTLSDGWSEGREQGRRYTVQEAACLLRRTGLAALLLLADAPCVLTSMKNEKSDHNLQVGMHILRAIGVLPIKKNNLRDGPKNNHASAVAKLVYERV